MESKSNLRDQFCVSYEAHNTPILMKPSGMFDFNNVLLTEVTDKNGAVLACLQLIGPETPLNMMLPHHKSALWYNKFLYRYLFSKLI